MFVIVAAVFLSVCQLQRTLLHDLQIEATDSTQLLILNPIYYFINNNFPSSKRCLYIARVLIVRYRTFYGIVQNNRKCKLESIHLRNCRIKKVSKKGVSKSICFLNRQLTRHTKLNVTQTYGLSKQTKKLHPFQLPKRVYNNHIYIQIGTARYSPTIMGGFYFLFWQTLSNRRLWHRKKIFEGKLRSADLSGGASTNPISVILTGKNYAKQYSTNIV